MATTLMIPWPHIDLTPHAKGGWRKKTRATKRQRTDTFWLAKEAKVPRIPDAILTFAYHPPNLARRDVQNMHGRLKGAIDGIADAMGCDDHLFRCRFPDHFAEVRTGGAIIITVEDPSCADDAAGKYRMQNLPGSGSMNP